MLKNVALGQYIPGESAIHKLDARTKILAILVYIVILFMVTDFRGYAFLALLPLIVILLTGIDPRTLFGTLRPVVFIIILTVVLHVFMVEGTPLFTLGPLTATREGLHQGAFMGLRLILLILTTSFLTQTTSPIDLTDGLERLMNPFRVIGLPAHELAMMMTIALRFIPTLLDEAEKIMKAQMARGADFESGNIFTRAKNMVPLLVPLFISAFRRADDLALAMEARCYRGGKNRTRMKVMKFTSTDAVAAAVMIALTAGVLVMRFGLLPGR